MDAYDPQFICNRSDVAGRYSFSEQPRVALWNLLRLAAPFQSLIGSTDAIVDILNLFADEYRSTYANLMRHKLGLFNVAKDSDLSVVIEPLLALLQCAGADYTLAMRALCDAPMLLSQKDDPASIDRLVGRMASPDSSTDDSWSKDMRAFLADVYKPRLLADIDSNKSSPQSTAAQMRLTNPRFILRNWVAQDVISRAANGDDACIDRVLDMITTHAFSDSLPDHLKDEKAYGGPVPKWGKGLQSSCSS
ncbi:hypothetical protein GGI22_001281 [Coemansia erecta]|nr:hypothetical protein GGI22_001281 [Coemansia erecta]